LGDRPRANDERDRATPRRRAAAWAAYAWLFAIIALSATASLRPQLILKVSHHIPGRDKTGHFVLMGGFGGVSVLAFAGRRLGGRRLPVLGVLAAVALFVVFEEFVQRWLPHRTFSLLDLAASLSGVACFGALAAAWRAREARNDR